MEKKDFFERWSIDRRFFYVWFGSRMNPFSTNESGANLAVTDDFGNLACANEFCFINDYLPEV